MKLRFEKHPEISRLAQYFKKIETMAENMGLDVDDLMPMPRQQHNGMYTSYKKHQSAIALHRNGIFSDHHKLSPPENSVTDMRIVDLNDKQFRR